MTELGQEHWTQDDELLERYVLNRLPAEERTKLDEHAQSCERCAAAIRTERELAAGLKRYGREELKKKLRERIRREERVRISWTQVAAIAAAIVVLVTVGLFHRQLFLDKPWVHEMREGEAPLVTVPPADRDAFPASEQSTIPADRSVEDRIRLTAPSEVRARRPLSEPGTKEEKRLRVDDRADEVVHAEIAAAAPVATGRESAADVEGDAQWIEGIVLKDERGKADMTAGVKKEALTQKEQRLLRNEEKSEKTESSRRISGPAGEQVIVLSQRPFSSLPPKMQQPRSEAQIETIRTMVSHTREGLTLVLFPRVPIPESDMRGARIEAVEVDSLVVYLGDRLIGYRMPRDWGVREMNPAIPR